MNWSSLPLAVALILVLPIAAQAQLRQSDIETLRPVMNDWRAKYLKPSSRVAEGAYVDYEGKQTTCSEALGYGMLITVMLAGVDPERSKSDFAALNKFRKAFRSNENDELTAWRVDDRSRDAVKTACATDGDLDIAFALLTAAREWSNQEYAVEARAMIAAIETSLVRDDFSLRRGDWDREQAAVRLSDVMPVHFRAFSKVSNKQLWEKVIDAHYTILDETVSENGVFPDFVVKSDVGWDAVPPKYLESEYDGMMYYNSCRVPWRLSWAVFANQDRRALRVLKIFSDGIGSTPNRDFRAGYKLNGDPIHEWTDGAFTAPHMCSLLATNRSAEYGKALVCQLGERESYFQDSIRLLSLILCLSVSE